MTLCDIERYVINVDAVTFLEPATEEEDSNPKTKIHFAGGESIVVAGTAYATGRMINPARDNN
jgi:hypothetical protein